MQQLKQVILASKSPRRKQLLEELGLKFDIIPGNVDESLITSKRPCCLVKKLSKAKAEAVFSETNTNKVIIASDTIVVFNNIVYGKPKDFNDACRMLSELNGKEHFVYTGVTILENGDEYTFFDKSKVKFKQMSEEQIKNYVLKSNPLDKAGAYGIQDKQVVESYTGSYSNIVGLPIEKVEEALILKGVIDGCN